MSWKDNEPKTPCYGCKKRKIACHSNCKDYNNFIRKRIIKNKTKGKGNKQNEI